jgi:Zn ribbon nucleic-acid-binding protein
MMNTEMESQELAAPNAAPVETDDAWAAACAQVIASVPMTHRSAVREALRDAHGSAGGLREWVSAIAFRGAQCPECVPVDLIQVYLSDPEAVPLHDCENCGLAVPVRPSRLHGMESPPEEEYFPVCPVCQGRTGPYYFWSRQAEVASTALRRRKPR